MTAETPPLSDEELAGLGLLDPAAPDADERAELVRLALARGATTEQVAAAPHLGELVVDLTLRPLTEATLREVVADTGLEWPSAQRLLTSIGLPVDPDQRLTAAEADAVHLLAAFSNDVLGEDATAQLGRVVGTAMARVAEALVTAFRLRFELPRRASGIRYPGIVDGYTTIAESGLPMFMRTLDALLRQEIVAVAERMWTTDADQSVVTLPRAVGFTDIVGYTERAETLSARELSTVLVAFDELTAAAVLRGRGQIVKTIGDEAMFATEAALDACRIALELVDVFGHGELPPVRVGIAAGEVVSVFGDVYGRVVNLAARLVATAEPSTVVVSEAVAEACAGALEVEALPAVPLKGFAEPVRTYRVVALT